MSSSAPETGGSRHRARVRVGGAASTGAASTGAASTGAASTGAASTGAASTGAASTGAASQRPGTAPRNSGGESSRASSTTSADRIARDRHVVPTFRRERHEPFAGGSGSGDDSSDVGPFSETEATTFARSLSGSNRRIGDQLASASGLFQLASVGSGRGGDDQGLGNRGGEGHAPSHWQAASMEGHAAGDGVASYAVASDARGDPFGENEDAYRALMSFMRGRRDSTDGAASIASGQSGASSILEMYAMSALRNSISYHAEDSNASVGEISSGGVSRGSVVFWDRIQSMDDPRHAVGGGGPGAVNRGGEDGATQSTAAMSDSHGDPFGENEEAYRALISVMRRRDSADGAASVVSGQSGDSSVFEMYALAALRNSIGPQNNIGPNAEGGDEGCGESPGGSISRCGSILLDQQESVEGSCEESLIAQFDGDEGQRQRKCYHRRCAKLIMGVFALAALGLLASYFVAKAMALGF